MNRELYDFEETSQISNDSVPCAKPEIPVVKLKSDQTYFHSSFLRKLSQSKVSNVNCNRLLLADPKITVYWSDFLTKINCKFPGVIQACHMNKVSFDEVITLYFYHTCG